MVAEDLDRVLEHYWGVFTEDLGSFVLAGDKVPRWPEGELLTDERGDFELQKSLSHLIYASQLV